MLSIFKTTAIAAAAAASIVFAAPADARPVTIDVTMNNFRGPYAYMAAYIVDSHGQYVSTVLTAGTRAKYLADLRRWNRMFQRAGSRVDGTSGASIGPGQSMRARVDIPDAMLNAGFSLRIETAIEDYNYLPDEAVVPLEDARNGKAIGGKGYVRSVVVSY